MRASYPTYKATSITWPESIPESWELVKISSVFRERRETVSDKDFAPLSVTMQGIVPQLETAAKTDNGDNRKKVCAGDFVINSRSDRKGSAGISPSDGSVSVISIVLKPSKKLHAKYVDYLLTNYYFQEEFYRYGKGIVADLWSTKYSSMKGMFIPFPSLEEQNAIANYLDTKTEQINRFIAKKEKLIKSLREKIDVIVQSIEGEQLNDSKFWPTIPKTWRVEKAKRIFIERNIKNKSSEALLASTQDRGVLPKDMCSENFVSPAGDLSGLKLVCENDFVISLRSFQGGIEYSPYRGIISPAYTIFNLREQYESPWMIQYYKYLFKTSQFISLLNTAITGIRDGKNVNWIDFAELPIPIPTEDDVKIMMEDFIRFEELVKVFEVEKQKLNEFKNSLIAEVVTGKIKVA